jgi:hypothetical protein
VHTRGTIAAVNFVGHAMIASRTSDDPVYALGAMLPDFASMIGARLGKHDHDALAGGIADHHRTDDAFHGTPTFVRLCRDEAIGLESIGLGWGASRAVAHVATELVLDGLLLESARVEQTYVDAIETIAWVLPALRFEKDGLARFRELHARLARYGPPHGYRDALFVRDRMVQILARRPRLALVDGDAEKLGAYLPGMAERVRTSAHTLFAELDSALATPPGPIPPL